jgi:hypothetical protein
VKSIIRGLAVLVFCLGTFGVLGCGPDNETEGTGLAKSIGDPGKPDAKGVPTNVDQAPPKSQEEFGQRSKERQTDMFKGGYPGAAKKK